ncbi:MAG TPA: protein phosphatase 2C domain-containing protein [Bryobacteraceae bacterium]|nr:protein phosphatase 2C domain-containing protein [Bryobacteraceae bacterium]
MVKAKVNCAGESNPGRVRRNNEDAWHMDPERGIFLVVDGIGGQAAGEKAAEIALGRVRARLERLTGTTEQRIREAIAMANNEIFQAARGNPEWQGMACVLTVAVLDNGSAVVGHVGDSRLYQVRRGEIRKITHDHSPVGEREDSLELTEAEAMRHPRRNEVFRDVGSEEHQPDDPDFIEIRRIPFDPDSALLLCSDGLSDQVPSADIRQIVERNAGKPQAAVRELIEAANRAGGKDNVTVLLVEGEQFTPPPTGRVGQALSPDTPPVKPRMLTVVLTSSVWFLCGLLIALAGAWFSRSFWVPPPAVVAPRSLQVGKGARFSSIAAALTEARSGDTVEVLIGEYREQLTLKSGVNLRSAVPREAILRAPPMGGGPAIYGEGVKNVRVNDFLIQGDEKQPLTAGIVLKDSDVEVDDVEVSGAGTGIEIRGGGKVSLTANAIHDCLREGVLIVGASTPWISHNSFQRNQGVAIAAREGARPSLVGNVFEKNKLELPPEISVDMVKSKNFLLDVKPGTPVSNRAGHAPPLSEGKKQ